MGGAEGRLEECLTRTEGRTLSHTQFTLTSGYLHKSLDRLQLLQRKVLWYQQYVGRWLFSMLLALLSGYGYRLWHILAAYAVVVSLFAVAYFVLGMHYPPYLHLDQAYLQSITAFHGRVFSEQFSSNTPQIWVTAFEAVTGLVIEGVFIAMLVQRFIGK